MSKAVKINRLGITKEVIKITSDPTKVDITTIQGTIKATGITNKVRDLKGKFLTPLKQLLQDKDLHDNQIPGTTKGFKVIRATVRIIKGGTHHRDNNKVSSSKRLLPDFHHHLHLKLDPLPRRHLRQTTMPCCFNSFRTNKHLFKINNLQSTSWKLKWNASFPFDNQVLYLEILRRIPRVIMLN